MSVKNVVTTEMLQSVKNAITQKIAELFPIGTIIQRNDSTSPSALYGGTWARIEGRFLLGVSGGGTLGELGGEAAHTLTEAEMPSHNHNFYICVSATGFGDGSVALGQWNTGRTELKYISNAGDGVAHNNMPPYKTVSIWERIA